MIKIILAVACIVAFIVALAVSRPFPRRRLTALELRRLGRTYAEIAVELDISVSEAYAQVSFELSQER